MKTSVRPSSMRTGTLTTRARRGKERRFSTPGSMSMTLATVSSCRQAILKVGELSKTGIGGGGIWPFPETVSVDADTEHSCTMGEGPDGILTALYCHYTTQSKAPPWALGLIVAICPIRLTRSLESAVAVCCREIRCTSVSRSVCFPVSWRLDRP